MSVVVTGAAGFLGCALVRALLARGETVVGIDRRPQAPRDGLIPLTADLLDRDSSVHAALAGARAVVHLAARPGVRDRGPEAAGRRHWDNVLATARVLALVPRDVPLVVTSSSSVYGGAVGGRPSRECDPLRPRGGYAQSKVEVERLCRQRLDAGGSVAIARPFTVIGAGQRPDMALSRWLAAATLGRPLRIFGSLTRTRDLTEVRDVARALLALVDRRALGTVNVGTGIGHSLQEMVDAVAVAAGVDVQVTVEPAGEDEVPDSLADVTRLRRLAGFVPHTDLPAAVARQLAASGLPLPPPLPTGAIPAVRLPERPDALARL